MRRRLTVMLATAMMLAMMVVGASAASAEPPGVEFRDGPASPDANCIGIASSDAIHNGQASTLGQGGDPSHGARGAEVKAAQANPAC
jgi:hypothetical protein